MKLLVLFLVVGVVCAVLFVAGVFSPPRSRRMQRATDKSARKAEREGSRRAGRFGNLAARAFRKSRKAADRSASAGRKVHRRISSGGSG